jgi:hypothetical protein
MVDTELRPVVLIITYMRPNLLLNLIESLEAAGELNMLDIVVIQQIGNEEVKKIVLNFKNKYKNVVVKSIDGSGKNSTENISFNRIEGLRICFEELRADYVIALEDDVQVASDIFEFTKFVMKAHWNKTGFRGVNYGSHELYSDNSSRNYSRVRYGIHGPASAITAKTWTEIYTAKNIKRSKYIIFDGLFEYYLKTGFMVTPENSRYIDLGYGGTHTSATADNPYFSKLKSSFVGNSIPKNPSYSFNEIEHSWRSDALIYKKWENFKYELLYFFNYRNDNFLFHMIERAIYRLLVLKKFTKVK